MTEADNAGAPDGSELIITRVFNAPLDLVWRAWTEAEHLAQWWGPKGFKIGVKTLDFRPGGMFHYSMTTADGHEMWGKFAYREIEKPGRIAFTNSFSDPQGGIVRNPWNPTWPLEMLNRQSFAEAGGNTNATLRISTFNASDDERKTFVAGFPSMQMGFKGTLDQLEHYLATL